MQWPLLGTLGVPERQAVLEASRRRRFAKGEVIIHEGDSADALHLVTSGHLAVKVSTSEGESVTVNILSPGDHFGELALVSGSASHQHRSATVAALEAAETMSISATVFHRLCAAHPDIEGLLVVMLAARVRDLSVRLLESQYVGLDRRLYRRLLELHTLYDESTIPLTQEQLADLVGGTRPSVNQVLQKLVTNGVVELGRGWVSVRDVSILSQKAGL